MNVISVDVETNDKLKKASSRMVFITLSMGKEYPLAPVSCQRSQPSTNDNAGFLRNGDQDNAIAATETRNG